MRALPLCVIIILGTGLLAAVGNLQAVHQNNSIRVNWTEPPSFDNRDITYCLQAVNSDSMAELFSSCQIWDTQFDVPTPPNVQCFVVIFNVTPINIVGTGERTSISYIDVEDSEFYLQLSDI